MYWPTMVVKLFHFFSQKLAFLSDLVMITEVTL